MWSAGVTVAGARAVTRAAFGHLAQLDLSDPGLADETIALVADVCPEVHTISPRLRALVRGARHAIP
ncbi:MAG: hypothetical protein NT062_12410 [Proteobacteria bacterium]|nr:hypothetical protein [Pseudomonadota bacterium]